MLQATPLRCTKQDCAALERCPRQLAPMSSGLRVLGLGLGLVPCNVRNVQSTNFRGLDVAPLHHIGRDNPPIHEQIGGVDSLLDEAIVLHSVVQPVIPSHAETTSHNCMVRFGHRRRRGLPHCEVVRGVAANESPHNKVCFRVDFELVVH